MALPAPEGGASLEDQTASRLTGPGAEKDRNSERGTSFKEKEAVDETVDDITEQVLNNY